MSRHPRTRRPRVDHCQLIHALNQRYFEQWHRAERLQREVSLLRATGAGLLLDGLRADGATPLPEPPLTRPQLERIGRKRP